LSERAYHLADMFNNFIRLFCVPHIHIKRKEVITDVRRKDLSKIITYLKTIFQCLNQPDNSFDNFTSSREDMYLIYQLALHFSPDLFIDKIFFSISQDQETFYHINEIPDQLLVKTIPSSLSIGDYSYEIERIFVFHINWLNEYYLEPMKTLTKFFH